MSLSTAQKELLHHLITEEIAVVEFLLSETGEIFKEERAENEEKLKVLKEIDVDF